MDAMSEIEPILSFLKGASGPGAALFLLGWLVLRAVQSTLASRGSQTQTSATSGISAGGDVAIGPSHPEMRCPPAVEGALARIALGVESQMGDHRRQEEMIQRLIAVEESNGQVLRAMALDHRVGHDLLVQMQAEARATEAIARAGGSGGR
jgi:hypothetical protein